MSSARRRASSAAAIEAGVEAFSSEGWLGREIDGRYRIESLLGEGGMGAVFLAEHIKLSKKVALKVILPQFAGDGELAERFAREAMASAKLDHPHVASALDYGALPEGGAYLVMQFVRGRSLRRALEALRQHRIEKGAEVDPEIWKFACEVGAQIADALSAAHAQRIVHRDLKPENVILEPRDDGSESAKVLDFGVARVADDAAAGTAGKALTRVGTIVGTPGYMAPEQALGETVDLRADLYALGIVIWEMIALRPLFADDDLTAIVTAQLTSSPPRLSTIAPSVPPELDDLVARLLARSRDDRPQRAGEVRDVLRRIVLGATIAGAMRQSQPGTANSSGAYGASTSSAGLSGAQTSGLSGAGPQGVGALPTVALASVERISRATVTGLTSAAEQVGSSAASALQQGTVDLGPVGKVPTSLVMVGCAVPLLVMALGFMLVLAVATGGSEPVAEPADVAPPPVPAEPAAVGVDPPGPGPEPEADTAAPPASPSSAEAESDQLVALRALNTRIPPTIAPDVAILLDAPGRSDRSVAAERIRDADVEGAPEFLEHVVVLELSNSCTARRQAIRELARIRDPRALRPLERMDDLPRRGCGFLNMRDCHACLRRDLSRALATIRRLASSAE